MLTHRLQQLSITTSAVFCGLAFTSGRLPYRFSLSSGLITTTTLLIGGVGILTFFLSLVFLTYERKINNLLWVNIAAVAYPVFLLAIFMLAILLGNSQITN